MACKNSYDSPRVSGEILDCSLPVTFDTYNKCSYNCLYCFSYYQKSMNNSKEFVDYQKKELLSVNVEKIKKLFRLEEGWEYFKDHIRKGLYIQWGGLADQFDQYEKKEGKTLELLQFFKEINYPISFSTKAVWWLKDKRYTDLFRGQKNWHMKFSIINLNKDKAKFIELGVPSPQERLEAIKQYTELGAGEVALRLRPFIIGLTDENDDYLKLIDIAGTNGAKSVSTEFFCVENRATQMTKERYFKISQVLGFDLVKYYKRLSTGAGYLRLNRQVKLPYVEKMQEMCDKKGMRLYVSDSHIKDYSPNACCCGLNDDQKYARAHFAEAMVIAKKKGFVRFSDLPFEEYKKYLLVDEEGNGMGIGYHFINTQKERPQWRKKTIYDMFKIYWNDTKVGKGVYQYFQGALVPDKFDEEGNIIFKYNGVKKND